MPWAVAGSLKKAASPTSAQPAPARARSVARGAGKPAKPLGRALQHAIARARDRTCARSLVMPASGSAKRRLVVLRAGRRRRRNGGRRWSGWRRPRRRRRRTSGSPGSGCRGSSRRPSQCDGARRRGAVAPTASAVREPRPSAPITRSARTSCTLAACVRAGSRRRPGRRRGGPLRGRFPSDSSAPAATAASRMMRSSSQRRGAIRPRLGLGRTDRDGDPVGAVLEDGLPHVGRSGAAAALEKAPAGQELDRRAHQRVGREGVPDRDVAVDDQHPRAGGRRGEVRWRRPRPGRRRSARHRTCLPSF